MPHTKAAKRDLRKSQVLREKNRAVRATLRTQVKKAKAAVEEKSENLTEQVRLAESKVDRAVKKNLLHRKKASRMKSQLAKAANAAAKAAAPEES